MAAPEKTAGHAAEVKPTTAAELAAAFPDLVTQIKADAASAERARITGIDNMIGVRKIPADLIASMKADPACTPDNAAARIVAHENKTLEAAQANIRGVEDVAGKVRAAPSAGGEEGAPQSAASTPDGWRAEFEKDKKLQAEFGTAERYVAYRQGVADGSIRILTNRASG